MNTKHFLKEILKGKTIGRATLSASLLKVFEKNSQYQQELQILELGSESASHQRVLPKKWKISRSNINNVGKIDYIFDANDKFPFEFGMFDGVVCFNTLYAIENQEHCLKESLRISKSFVIFNTPLISGLAPHPTDFHRYTKQGLEKLFTPLNIKSYKIIPLGGSFSSGVSLIDNYLRYRIIRIPIYLVAVLFDNLDKVTKRECPLQYIVILEK